MTQQSRKRLISVDEYHKMAEAGILGPKDRVELIQGEILIKNPIESKHAAVVSRVMELFVSQFLEKTTVHVQSPIQIKNFSQPEPDVLLLEKRSDNYFDQLPQPQDVFLLVEVANSTLAFDMNEKLAIYAAARIKEYWIVDLVNTRILLHSIPEDQIYKEVKIATIGDSIECKIFPETSFAVKDILG